MLYVLLYLLAVQQACCL